MLNLFTEQKVEVKYKSNINANGMILFFSAKLVHNK